MRKAKSILSIDIIDISMKCGLILLELPLFLSVDLSAHYPLIDNFINIMKVVSFLFFAILWVTRSDKKSLSTGTVLLILLVCVVGVSTQINGAEIGYYLIVWGGFTGVVFLVESLASSHFSLMLSTLRLTFSILIVANCMTVFLFPDGLWQQGIEGYWLIGHRNSFGPLMITGIAICAIHDQYNLKRFSVVSIAVYLSAMLSTIVTWSATSVVTVCAAVGITLFIILKPTRRFPNPFVTLLAYASIDLGIVLFNIQYYFEEIINALLHRSASLTGRVQLWSIVKNKIAKSPAFGYGVLRSENNGLTVYSPAFVHAHNGWLDIAYTGGVVSLTVYIAILISASASVYKHRTEKIAQLAFACLVAHLIYSITNLFLSSYTVLILLIIFNLESSGNRESCK